MSNPPSSLAALSLCVWNAQGVVDKRLELYDFLEENQIDIALITETHLNPSKNFNLPNFTCYRCDRIRNKGGGVMILIKDCISSCLINSDNTQQHESVTIRTKFSKAGIVNITCLYNPPRNIIESNQFMNYFDPNINCILAGDLNAKYQFWGCYSTNKVGKHLNKLIEDNNLFLHVPDQPTYYSLTLDHRPDTLDYAVTNFNFPCDLFTINDLSSDHLPFIICTEESINDNRKQIHMTNWDKYTQHLIDNRNFKLKLQTENDIDEQINFIQNKMTEAKQTATKIKEVHYKYMKIPKHIKDIIKQKNRQRKKFQRNPNPRDKHLANVLTKRVKKELDAFRQQAWAETLIETSGNDNKLWTMTKALKRSKSINRPLHTEQGLVYTDEEKVEAFADSLELQFTENATPCNLDEDDRLERHIARYFVRNAFSSPCPPPTSVIEVKQEIKKLKNKKAPGEDKITNEMIKALPICYISKITSIFNKCLYSAYFPNIWKKAEIILFEKSGKDSKFAKNFRPISLLSNIAKLFEKIIMKRLKNHINFIPQHQFGFTPKRGTVQQLMRVTDFLVKSKDWNMSSVLAAIDCSAAFDKCTHESILYKMIINDIPYYLIKIISSYLKNRSFHVKYRNHISTVRQIQSGVAQGSIIGPTLYLISVSDFPSWNDPNTLIASFADDIAIIQRSRNSNLAIRKLQEKIYDIEEWCENNRIKINAEKSQLIVFNKKRKNTRISEELDIFDEKINVVNSVSYLGVTFSKTLSWKAHIEHATNKAYAMKRRLLPLIGRTSNLALKTKRRLYLSILRPIITYASPVWATAIQYHKEPARIFQNKTALHMANAPWYVRRKNLLKDLKIENMNEILNTLNRNFIIKNSNQESCIKDIIIENFTSPPNELRPIYAIIKKNPDIYDAVKLALELPGDNRCWIPP